MTNPDTPASTTRSTGTDATGGTAVTVAPNAAASVPGITAAALNNQVLAGFQPGDVLDISDLDPTLTSVTAGYDAVTGQLEIRQDTVLKATVTMPAGLVGTFTVVTDGNHGAAIQLLAYPDEAALRTAAAAAIRAQAATALYGVDGTGVTVGIISSSFNTLGGTAQDIANGNLPSGLRILSDLASPNSDEGRSMAQVIHAAAPGASIVFAQSGDSVEAMAAAVASLIQAGVQVIVDDVGFPDEPFWQSAGALNQAVDAAAAGIVFVTAAGNAGHAYYEHQYTLTDTILPGGIGASHAYDFNLGQGSPSYRQTVTMTSNGMHAVTLQWDQPAGQVTKWLTLHVLQLQADGTYAEVGTPFQATNGTAAEETLFQGAGTFSFAITGTDPDDTGTLRYLVVNNGGAVTIDDPNAGQGTGDLYGHALNANEITVAESLYATPTVTTRSSAVGPGEYLFDPAGNRLAQPQLLNKPDITAAVGAATDSTGVLTPFTGTSAAAPNVAAVVALMLQANPGLTPAQVKAALQASALATAEPAAASGAGLVQADAAVALARPVSVTAIAATSDAPGTPLGAGHAVTVTLTTSVALTVTPGADGGTPRLLLNGGVSAVFDAAASGGTALVFRAVIGAGQDTGNLAVARLALNGATVLNQAGLALAEGSLAAVSGAASGIVVDTTPPAVTITLDPSAGPAAPPRFTGTTEAGAAVSLSAGSGASGATVADAAGRWSYALAGLPDGTDLVTARATDAAGNGASAALPVTVAQGRAGTTRSAAAGQTLVAGSGPDTLVGAADGPSTLTGGGGGGATFVARGGATRIEGGAGFDTIRADSGDVTVAGGAGGSLVSLGSGAALVGVAAGSTVLGGTGTSTIATAGSALVGLGAGPSFVFAAAGGTVIGGAGATLVAARDGGVVAFGGAGSTVFIGGTTASTVAGGQGSGTVFGGKGGGVLSGGAAGHNVLVGGQGAATLFGGGGGDVLFATGPAGSVLVAGSGNETLQGAASTGNDVFFAGPGTTLIGLGSGQDKVFAGPGSSTVVGGAGPDTYAVVQGQAGGSMSIYGFKAGIDHLSLAGFDGEEASRALASARQDTAGPLSGPATTITLSDNTRISFLGLGGLDAGVFG